MSEGTAWFLVHDSSFDAEAAGPWLETLLPQLVAYGDRESIPAGSTVLLWLGDEQIRDLSPLALQREWTVALLAHPEAHEACTALGVKGDPAQLITHYASAQPIRADALTCNGELVFSSVVLGSVLTLRPFDINRPQTTFSILRGALRGLGKLSLRSYRLVTAKEQVVNMATLGMVAIGQTQSSLVGRRFDENLSIDDGRVSMLAIAPRSVLGYL